ncbi:ATP-binding protein [Virgibacillus sp. AGTR]|uniref:sensor histidine kinase n=1 Tax=unclassified Virgibacillus TaxID=2620237 RepID=UPI001965DEED|nr:MULTISPECIES: ATP-binding protein [unclassified Virgibacillus]MCC2252381.1 ATP-binding protein [Virgibacillus sp. AGTR]MDY7045130.1 ATP-binding protein [Virgibacillus sp. M23]QRZ19654.1 ATP-binding protein [Virgibacillus sp. AGTR]
MRLRTKIQLFSSLFILVLIVLINTSIYVLFYKISTDSQLEQLAEQTDTLVKTIKEHPDVTSKELLRSFSPQQGMIQIVDRSETAMKSSSQSSNYKLAPKFTNTETQMIQKQAHEPDVAVVSKPIIWETGKHAGEVVTLQVSKHLVTLDNTMTTLFYVLLAASGIMLIPIIIAGNVLSRFLLNPIKAFIHTMRENMKEASWKKIDVDKRSRDEIYEMEKTFNEMIDHLKDNFEKQEIFVSDASHELKTPISIVKSYAQLLERRGTGNPSLVKESIEAIDSEADRMSKLVEQMLSLAKNKESAVMKKVDIADLVEETVTTFRGAYSREIQFDQVQRKLLVNGSRDQLEQVIYILIDNALKYSNEKIEVRLEANNNQAVFSVRDYGAGIPAQELDRIFERFYRVDKARSRDTGGTGLGLAIAKAIVKEHQGKIAVISEMKEGSTFTVSLPIVYSA